MKKWCLITYWILILPYWAVFALLHAVAAFITNILFSVEQFLGNEMDGVEFAIRRLRK